MRSHYYGSNWAGKIGWGISLVVMVLATTTFYHRHKHEELGIGYQQGEILSPKGYVGFCREAVDDEQRRFTELVEKMNEPDYEAKSGEIEEILKDRDSNLNSAGCKPGCESWLYFWNDESGKLDTQFRNEHTCGENPNNFQLLLQGFNPDTLP